VEASAGRLTIDCPVACVIRVQGALDPRWSDRLDGLQVAVCADRAAGATTELRGELLDQAALVGVLTTLYNLRLPLLEVACAPADGPDPVTHAGPSAAANNPALGQRRRRWPAPGDQGEWGSVVMARASVWRLEVNAALVRCSRCGAPMEAGELVARHATVREAVAHPMCVGVAPAAPPTDPHKRRPRAATTR
jgi:hypothetical protein